MDLELTGKVAVITGASRGVGKAIARELAKEGVDVAICARHREALEEAAGELEQETGRRILPVPTDTTNWESVRRMVETTAVTLGRVDILVNNAATPGGLVRGALADASDEALLEDIDTKVVGYFRCAKAVAPYMQRQGWGRIINIGGLSGRQSAVLSGMRNAAIVHLTKTLSDQLGPRASRSTWCTPALRAPSAVIPCMLNRLVGKGSASKRSSGASRRTLPSVASSTPARSAML